MPFIRLQIEGEPEKIEWRYPLQPEQVPLLCFPGILGDWFEFRHLVQSMRDQGDKRPVFVYVHPNLTHAEDAACVDFPFETLEEQAQSIANSIKDDPNLPADWFMYPIVGYSYGCTLATLTAGFLTKKGYLTDLYLIDGPAPALSKEYFGDFTNNVYFDLLAIVEAAMTSSQINVDFDASCFNADGSINLKTIQREALTRNKTNLSPSDFILFTAEIIRENLLESQFEDMLLFNKYIEIAAQGIRQLIEFDPANTDVTQLNRIVTLMTHETIAKYNRTKNGGWDSYSKNKVESPRVDATLLESTHRTLLTEEKAKVITSSLLTFIKNLLEDQTRYASYLGRQFELQILRVFTSFSALNKSTSALLTTLLANTPTRTLGEPDIIGPAHQDLVPSELSDETFSLSSQDSSQDNSFDSGSDSDSPLAVPASDSPVTVPSQETERFLEPDQCLKIVQRATEKVFSAKSGAGSKCSLFKPKNTAPACRSYSPPPPLEPQQRIKAPG